MAGNGLTPTHRRMLDLLSDGLAHTQEELHGCLWDEQSELSAVHRHLSTLRQSLRPKGEDLACRRRNGTLLYQHVRLVPIKGE